MWLWLWLWLWLWFSRERREALLFYFNCRSIFHYYIRLDVHDLNSTIVSLPGNLRVPTKDKEKNLEVRFEKKGKKGENDVEKGKAEPTVDEACWIHEQLKSASCILRLLELWMNLFLGALHRTFRTHYLSSATRMYTRVLSRNENWRMALSLRRSWK